jgi:hypothetical protein
MCLGEEFGRHWRAFYGWVTHSEVTFKQSLCSCGKYRLYGGQEWRQGEQLGSWARTQNSGMNSESGESDRLWVKFEGRTNRAWFGFTEEGVVKGKRRQREFLSIRWKEENNDIQEDRTKTVTLCVCLHRMERGSLRGYQDTLYISSARLRMAKEDLWGRAL